MVEPDRGDQERAQTRIKVEEIGPGQTADLQAIADILNDPVNSIHFTQASRTVEDLRKLAARPDYHLLGARNELGEIVGTFSIIDETKDVNTHLIEKTAVRSDLHSKGVGRQMFEKAIRWCFETNTFQGVKRKILQTWVEEELPGWEKMQALIYSLGFVQMLREPDLIVKVINGEEREIPAARYHLRRDRYEEIVSKEALRERKEFIVNGGIIREVDLSKEPKVAEQVAALYLQPSAIEHFSDLTPFPSQEEMDSYLDRHPLPPNETEVPPTNPDEIKKYYENNPRAKLLVAELGGEIIGATTVVRTLGLSEAKLIKVVVKANESGKGVGFALVREGITKSFASPEQGGFGVNAIIIGYILNIQGERNPKRLFEAFGFENSIRYRNRCLGWDNESGQLVYRDVQQMVLHKYKAPKV